MTALSTKDSHIVLRFLAAPMDITYGGTVHGGKLLEWIDKAGYACAAGWSGRYCVTVYVGDVRFTRPVAIGEIVEVEARLVHTGRTSMHILVSVSSADPKTGEYTEATRCLTVFVAVDPDGRPAPVPAWQPTTSEAQQLQAGALRSAKVRADIEAAMEQQTYTAAGTALERTLRFLAAPSDVNWGGKVHGGTVMRWIDEAAYACAVGWVGGRPLADHAIGVYSGGIHFLAPVRIGDLVEVDARIILTGPHSMHVSTRVWTADPRTPDQLTLTTQCLSVFVVPDDSGVALPVPQWKPELPEDVRLHEHARAIVGLRETIVPIAASLTLEP